MSIINVRFNTLQKHHIIIKGKKLELCQRVNSDKKFH